MKNGNIKQILLLICAIVAVYVAFMPNSVVVYTLEQNVLPYYCSYLTLVEDVTGNICTPLAAVCACIVLMLSGIYMVSKKVSILSAVKLLSMIGAMFAVGPILVKDGTVQVVPNVLVPIALLTEYVVANYLVKQKETPTVKLAGRRLK